MAIQIQHRRGSTTAHSTFTGAAGELTVDTTKNTVVVHDGVTPGGAPLSTAGANTDITSLTGLSGNVSFTGTGNRITGDFSNATIANRVMFQDSALNQATVIGAIPNGTSPYALLQLYNSSTPANSSYADIRITPNTFSLMSENTGTGSYLPMTFYTGGFERMRIDTSGNVLVTSPAGLGYGTGAGGTVTQATSKSTAVTLNKPCGQITMNNALMNNGDTAVFQVMNSLVSANDGIEITTSGNFLGYELTKTVYSGAFYIRLANRSGVALSEAVVINFQIIKGATA